MKMKWLIYLAMFTIVTVLSGCEPLMVLDPKGPQAKTQANDIMISIFIMSFIVIVVFRLFCFLC